MPTALLACPCALSQHTSSAAQSPWVCPSPLPVANPLIPSPAGHPAGPVPAACTRQTRRTGGLRAGTREAPGGREGGEEGWACRQAWGTAGTALQTSPAATLDGRPQPDLPASGRTTAAQCTCRGPAMREQGERAELGRSALGDWLEAVAPPSRGSSSCLLPGSTSCQCACECSLVHVEALQGVKAGWRAPLLVEQASCRRRRRR